MGNGKRQRRKRKKPEWKKFLQDNPDPGTGPCPGKYRKYTPEEYQRRREMFREKGPDGKVSR